MFKGKFIDIVNQEDGFLRGPFGSALKKSLFVPKGTDTYKVYEQGVVLNQNKDIGNYFISKEYFENNLKRFEVKSGDFLVSCSGVNYGAIYHLTGEIEKGVINQALLRIRLNSDIVDENYFLYYFKSYIAKVITSGTGDSTIPNFPSMTVIKSIKVELPDIDIQRKIGQFLKTLNDKIEVNNRINNELEQFSKTIYDYWFLQFDFPDENGKPYKSSGGKMVWNKILKREIPEGWEVKNLKDVLVEKQKSNIQVNQAQNKFGKYPFFTNGNIILEWESSIVEGKNCFLSTGGNANIKYFIGKSAYSTDTWCISATNNLENYLYLWLKSLGSNFHSKYFAGTGLKHLQKDLLKKTRIVIPNISVIDKFNKIITASYTKISKNYLENKELKSLRDFLLPLLMNRQVTFKNTKNDK